MKMTKKVLSIFLAMLILSATLICVSADSTVTHQVGGGTTLIRAVDYSSTNNGFGTRDYTANGINGCIPISSSGDVLDNVYKINVANAGWYRVKVWLSRTESNISAEVSIGKKGQTPATGAGIPGDGIQTVAGVETDSVNLAAGTQELQIKIKALNNDTNKADSFVYFYYVELEKVEIQVGSGKTLIRSIDYATTSSTSGIRDYGYNGVKYCMPIHSSESVNLGSSGGLNNVYSISVAEAGQYRVTAYISRVSSVLRADVCVVNDGDVVARTISSVGSTGVTNAHPVVTPSFNLSAGSQDLHLRIHSVNIDPTKYEDNYLFFFYFELEKIDSVMESAELSEINETAVEPESYAFTDQGITKTDDSVIISANKQATLYVDAPVGGEYAFSLKYKASKGTKLYANTNTLDIYKGELMPSDDEYITQTLSFTNLKSGSNRINLKPTKDLEIEKIYILKTAGSYDVTDINSAATDDELKSEIKKLEENATIYLSDGMSGLFYEKPVYKRLLKNDYSSVKDFVKKYNDALIYEYNNPWVSLYINGVKQTELASGNIKFTASTGYIPKDSTMVAAIYRHVNEAVVLHNFGICTKVSQNTYDFNLGNTEIKSGENYTVEFFYWDGLKKINPIEVFESIYEEIYVSNDGNDTSGDGSYANPYATLQKALEKVSEINDYQWGDIIVNVESGIYTLTETLEINEEHSGKNGYNVIIRGEDGEQPLISGGKKVTGWRKASGGIWKAPLSDVEYARNLYINGYPAIMARSERHYNTAMQKDGSVPTTVYGKEETPGVFDVPLAAATTGLKDDTVAIWEGKGFSMSREELEIDIANPVGMEIVWPYTFENHITPVVNFTKTDKNVMFYVNADLLGRRAKTAFSTGVSFYIQNAKELLDKPGEFFYDKDEGFIYYYPYEYENMLEADAYVGNVEGMVKVAGSSLNSKVTNMTFENLKFRYGAYNFINKYGYIGSQTDGILVPFGWSEGKIGYLAQFAVDNADNVNIKGCEFSCLGSAGISMIDSVSNSSIDGNIIRDIAGTGIRVGHPTHNRQREGIEVCRNIDITNNVIRRIAGETFNNCGITVYYEKFINILHNDIENVPYSGMSIGWGWGGGAPYDCSDIDVSYNKVQNVMNTLHDGGGIYTLGPLKNTKVSNNYLKGHGSRSGGMLYNDQGSAYVETFNNVVLGAVLSHSINSSNTTATRELKIHDNYSDVGTHSKVKTEQKIEFEEYTIVSGEGETLNNENAREIYRNAGLEDEYRWLLTEPGVELPAEGRKISTELPDPVPSDVIMMSAAEYDLETSTDGLEMLTYADGIGVALNYGESVNYKLDIPEAGYYRIIFRAMGDSSVNDGIKISGDAQDVTMRVYCGKNGGVTNQLAIADSTFYNYRICTAYFDKGVKNLTVSVATSGDRVIIKEVHYANLLKTVKSNGVNIIPLKNYYKVSGLNTNTFENNQYGYPSEGAKFHISGAVTNGGNKTTTLTYKLNVEEAGTYKVTAASWVGAHSPVTYQILIGGEVKSEGTTKTYSAMKKSEDTVLSDLVLPAGEVELQFKAKSNGDNYSIMYYFTLEKK